MSVRAQHQGPVGGRTRSQTSAMRATVRASLRSDADMILAAAEANEKEQDRQMDVAQAELDRCQSSDACQQASDKLKGAWEDHEDSMEVLRHALRVGRDIFEMLVEDGARLDAYIAAEAGN